MKEAFDLIRKELRVKKDNLAHNLQLFKDKKIGNMVSVCKSKLDAYIDALSIVYEIEAEYNKKFEPTSDLIEYGVDGYNLHLKEQYRKGYEDAKAEYDNGWITGRMPTKEECGDFRRNWFLTTVDANGLHTIPMQCEYTTVRGKEVSRWLAYGRISPWEVLAWRPMQEPYKPET